MFGIPVSVQQENLTSTSLALRHGSQSPSVCTKIHKRLCRHRAWGSRSCCCAAPNVGPKPWCWSVHQKRTPYSKHGSQYTVVFVTCNELSLHMRKLPSFFSQNRIGAPEGDWLSSINPLANNSCTWLRTSSISMGDNRYSGREVGLWEPGKRGIVCRSGGSRRHIRKL
jgi:hypothetical protein